MTEVKENAAAAELTADDALRRATQHVGEALQLLSHAQSQLTDEQLASKSLSNAFGRASAMLDVAGLMTEGARRGLDQ